MYYFIPNNIELLRTNIFKLTILLKLIVIMFYDPIVRKNINTNYIFNIFPVKFYIICLL